MRDARRSISSIAEPKPTSVPAAPPSLASRVKAVNRVVVDALRGHGDLPLDMDGERLLLLTTAGVRTGRAHTLPLMFHGDGDRLLVVASNLGAARHPDWYLNLIADPHVTVEVGNERYDAVATPLVGADREPVWDRLKQNNRFLAEHEARTSRQIPVVVLARS